MSTNNIDKMGSLSGMPNIRVLSVGRNLIKKIDKLDDIAGTLEELWISYNQIKSLDGLVSDSLPSPLTSLTAVCRTPGRVGELDDALHIEQPNRRLVGA